jgi:hypothetical protein
MPNDRTPQQQPDPPDPADPWSGPAVRTDRGGWLSGPYGTGLLATDRTPEAVHRADSPMLDTVMTVAELGAELPLWRVAQNGAGMWVAVRAATETAGPVRLSRLLLSVLATAMTGAELQIVRHEHPGWSIRHTEYGKGWMATRAGASLTGRTIGELAAQLTEAG